MMSEIGKQILDVVQSGGKSASEMTSGLKAIGNNSMHDGIKRISNFFASAGKNYGYSEGLKAGTVKGALVATGATLFVGGLTLLIKDIIEINKDNNAIKTEGEAIVTALEKSAADCDVCELIESENNIEFLENDIEN